MTDSLSRRDFLKLAAVSSAAAAVLTGCGTAARYVKRQPYSDMPEYTLPGQSTYFATTCRQCPAACGLIVRTVEGRAVNVQGNPNHPVNRGNTCSRAQASLQGLYDPDRLEGPYIQSVPGSGSIGPISWDTAIGVVAEAFQKSAPGKVAFLLGQTSDHLFDLATEISAALGGPPPWRYGALGMFEGRATLLRAAEALLGKATMPQFDLGNADVILSFGANFAETWLSPLSFGRAYGQMRQEHFGRRGYLVQFEPRMSLTAASADEWIPIVPGSEGIVAEAIARLIGDTAADVSTAAQLSGVSEEKLRHLAEVFATAQRKVALPGGGALGHTNGLEAVKAILALNILVNNLGVPGGVFFVPPVIQPPASVSSLEALANLVERIHAGNVETLFIHGVNPLFELPQSLGFAQALQKVPTVISFASFLDETALWAKYILPDHTPLESWGYQKIAVGSDRPALSAVQPVVVPLYNTKSTADVLLAAVQAVGGLPDADEVSYLQTKTSNLTVPWQVFLQRGGWWPDEAQLQAPTAAAPAVASVEPARFFGEGEFYLLPFPHPHLGDGAGANSPWLQETPDPMTTVMWDSWVEINPKTADRLGLSDDDVVKISSEVGEIEAVVYRYPAIRPDTVAIPFGQGHTQLGQTAKGRGANPLEIISLQLNAAGDLAFAATKVTITPTGKKHKLARFEDRVGVYGQS